MRTIRRLVVHGTATPPSMDIGADTIREWHTDPDKKGGPYADIGYHEVIRRNGVVETGRYIQRVGAHARGHNHDSIGLALVGGVDKLLKPDFNYTKAQLRKLRTRVNYYLERFPGIEVCGHRDLPGTSTDCPSFDVRGWLDNNPGIDAHHIQIGEDWYTLSNENAKKLLVVLKQWDLKPNG